MAKLDQGDIEKALGKEHLKGVRAAAKEEAKEKSKTSTGERQREKLNEVLEKIAASPGAPVMIHVKRRQQFKARLEFVGIIDYIDVPTLQNLGVESIVQDFSGGGHYQCTIKSPATGDDEFVSEFEIAGDPLPGMNPQLRQQPR